MTKEGAIKGTMALSIMSAFAWVCLFLFWHFKILGAIATMINQAAPAKPGTLGTKSGYSVADETMDEIEDAGCRAFSYLVSSLDPDKNPAYLLLVEDLLRKGTAPPVPGKVSWRVQCPDVKFSLDELPDERKRKCGEIRTWWTLHAKEFHQGWRVWSSHCAKD